MRKAIIDILKNSEGKFISGESMAGTLGISRTAIWKHIQKLREHGYKIFSREKLGYKLDRMPDLLLPIEIQNELDTKIIGREMIYKDKVNSTNHVAKALAHAGAADGTIVVAEEQTGGKGRLDRNFYSPRSRGIWFSVILRPKFLTHDAPKCTLMAAVAVAEAMNRFNLKAEIKWPNDIMFDGRKLVGILTEVAGEIGKINYIVVGIGINVNIDREEFPENIRSVAASLSEMNGGFVSRIDFFRAVLEEFDKLYLEANACGFGEILKLWQKYNITLGKNIRVISAGDGETFTGKAIDLDTDGALVVKTEDGLRTVYAGDVSIR